MKAKKQLISIFSAALCVVMLLTSACAPASAAGKTPIGYFEYLPDGVQSDDIETDEMYLNYKQWFSEDGVAAALYDMADNYQDEIYLYQYNLTRDQASPLARSMIYAFPELCYINGYQLFSVNDEVYAARPRYSSYITDPAEMKAAFYAEADKYLALVDDSMDDFTKAIVLHDAFIADTHYAHSSDGSYSNSYTCMVKKYGVCEDYAKCYAYLLAQCGIKSEFVTSDSMWHSWLKVQLDGSYYNIDPTWDDISPEHPGRAQHNFYLFSDSAFQSTEAGYVTRAHTDYRSIHAADDTRYDAFSNLHGFISAVCPLNGKLYAINKQGNLVSYNASTDETTLEKQFSYYWKDSKNNTIYAGDWMSLVAYDGKLYYNSPYAVYAYDPETGIEEKFADIPNREKYLFGMMIHDGKLWGCYAENPYQGYAEPVYMRDMKDTFRVSTDGNTAGGTVTTDTPYAAAGDTVTLTVSPDEGYTVESVTVNGEALTLSNGAYSFVMPSEDVYASAVFVSDNSFGARLAGHTLSLDGDIGINFYMELDSGLAESDAAFMRFTVPKEGGETEISTVRVRDAIKTEIGGKTYYVFKCGVAPKHMSEAVSAQMTGGGRVGTVYHYSVKEYAEYLLGHSEEPSFAEAAPLVRAMLNYGAYTQQYFDPDADNLANESLSEEDKTPGDITSDTINRYSYSVSLPAGVSFSGATLSLKSKTTLSLYFTGAEQMSFSCADKPIETETNGRYQIVRISDIAADELDDSFTVTASSDSASGSVSYSPMNYCCLALDKSNENLKPVVRAIYTYWLEADRYFA